MASISAKASGLYRCHFHFGEKRYCRSLGTYSEKEAREKKAIVERTLRAVAEGLTTLPEGSTEDEMWRFLISGGKITGMAKVLPDVHLYALGIRFIDHRRENVEPSTVETERKHFRHFYSYWGKRKRFASIDAAQLRDYIKTRRQEKGIRGGTVRGDTIRKELATFRLLWQFAKSEGFVSGECPLDAVQLPKRAKKGAFKTWLEIEAILAHGGFSEAEEAELWECLFLTGEEITAFLAHIKETVEKRPRYAWIYAALCFVAYTGARRSEMFRVRKGDVNGRVTLRERKGDRTSVETTRDVPLHPKLRDILDDWLANHPGGPYVFCKPSGNALEDRTSRDAWEAVTNGSKWEKLRGYHVLRHSFASNLARTGKVPEYRVREYMGHRTEEMSRRYRHLFPSDRADDISQLGF